MAILMYMSKKHAYSVAEARNHLPALIRDAEDHPVEISRRGKPVAVLLSRAEYDRLRGKRPSFWAALQEFRRKYDLESLDIDVDEIFRDVRDRSPGRKVSL